jgi:tetratricopeptide (TPR) repeat protein
MKTLSLSSLILCGLAPLVAACGPWLPSLLLAENKQEALRSPKPELVGELQHLPALPKLPPGIRPHEFDREEYRLLLKGMKTANRSEGTDVDHALAYYKVPLEARKAATAGYWRIRHAMDEIRQVEFVRKSQARDAAEILEDMVKSTALPPELGEYLLGAIAFHCGDDDAAREAWERLLARPPAQRHFRSTWAAYMLGRMAFWDAEVSEAKRAEAIRRLEQVRTLVQEGCEDTLNLVGESYFWEAMLQRGDNRQEEEARLGGLSLASGCASGVALLRGIGDEILTTNDEAMRARAARNPLLRQLATVCALVRFDNFENWYPDEDRVTMERELGRWLKAVEATGVQRVEEADRIAWAFYDSGNFQAAETWLRKAPANSSMTLWLRGKLDLRAGRNTEARERFTKAARQFPAPKLEVYPKQNWWWYEPASVYPLTPSHQLQADIGMAQLAQGNFTQALDALLHTGAWLDAAYVAEQVMTPRELLAYFQMHPELQRKTVTQHVKFDEDEWNPMGPLRENVPQAFRYLLARRLARDGQLREAQVYMPEPVAGKFRDYCRDMQIGRDRTQPGETRAAALWEAARIHRYLGMELFGAETAPDWSFYKGAYEEPDVGGLRAGLKEAEWDDPRWKEMNWVPAIAPAETARNLRWRPAPNARFHYRYVAAELAWQAAKLRPPDEETARMLCVAGGWLKYRDPQAADRFYQELVGRCANTALGKEGEKKKWFPPTTDEVITLPWPE